MTNDDVLTYQGMARSCYSHSRSLVDQLHALNDQYPTLAKHHRDSTISHQLRAASYSLTVRKALNIETVKE